MLVPLERLEQPCGRDALLAETLRELVQLLARQVQPRRLRCGLRGLEARLPVRAEPVQIHRLPRVGLAIGVSCLRATRCGDGAHRRSVAQRHRCSIRARPVRMCGQLLEVSPGRGVGSTRWSAAPADARTTPTHDSAATAAPGSSLGRPGRDAEGRHGRLHRRRRLDRARRGARPRVARRVMWRYFDAMQATLERHGGTVEKFIGDAVVAVFGVPVVHEDDALRAIRAAHEMREVLERLNVRARERVRRAHRRADRGQHGPGDRRRRGARQKLASGDAVNVAARLEQAARPGEVLLGEATYGLVAGAAVAEAAPAVEAKGKSRPLAAWRVLGLRPDVPAFARRVATPYIGRERELGDASRRVRRRGGRDALLPRDDRRAARDRQVPPDPRARAGSLENEARVVVGRCVAYGDGITYLPLAEIVHEVAGDDPEPELARAARERRARRDRRRAGSPARSARATSPARPRRPPGRSAGCSRRSRRRARSSSWSTTSTGPSRRCSTCSSTCSASRAARRSCSSASRGRTCSTPGRPGRRPGRARRSSRSRRSDRRRVRAA